MVGMCNLQKAQSDLKCGRVYKDMGELGQAYRRGEITDDTRDVVLNWYGGGPRIWLGERGWQPYSAEMYGPIFDPDPLPEKSPQERALDDFIAKRKAKREAQQGADVTPEATKSHKAERKEIADGKALDRALSKAFIHHSAFGERVMMGNSLSVRNNG